MRVELKGFSYKRETLFLLELFKAEKYYFQEKEKIITF